MNDVIEMYECLKNEFDDEWAKYDNPHYPFDEVGYNPYAGEFDADL